jgi:hypothetical protein
MKKIRNLAICLAILGVGAPAAADVKAYNGAFCQPGAFFDYSHIDHDAVFGVTALTNGMEVVCPLIRDRINSATSLTQTIVEFFNYTASGDHPSCSLFAQVEDTAGSYTDFESASTTTSGHAQLIFSGLTSISGNESTYGLQCTLGVNDQIKHINMNESNSATD